MDESAAVLRMIVTSNRAYKYKKVSFQVTPKLLTYLLTSHYQGRNSTEFGQQKTPDMDPIFVLTVRVKRISELGSRRCIGLLAGMNSCFKYASCDDEIDWYVSVQILANYSQW